MNTPLCGGKMLSMPITATTTSFSCVVNGSRQAMIIKLVTMMGRLGEEGIWSASVLVEHPLWTVSSQVSAIA